MAIGFTGTGSAWLADRFGEAGLDVQRLVPAAVRSSHERLAEAHEVSELVGHQVYGNVWLRTFQGLVEALASLPGAALIKPARAPYTLVTFGSTVIFPWRYAREAGHDPDDTSFGHISDTRQNIFDGFPPDPQMSLLDLVDEEPEGAAIVRELSEAGHHVVVVAYASAPDGLFQLIWGDAELVGENLPLKWGYREQLSLEVPGSGATLTVVTTSAPERSFDDAPLGEHDLKPRTALGPAATNDDGDEPHAEVRGSD